MNHDRPQADRRTDDRERHGFVHHSLMAAPIWLQCPEKVPKHVGVIELVGDLVRTSRAHHTSAGRPRLP